MSGMKPTNEQLNEAAAKLCGYKKRANDLFSWHDPKTKECLILDYSGILPRCPYRYFRPATDRNVLSELLAVIEREYKAVDFVSELPIYTEEGDEMATAWKLLNLPLRVVVIAALKACEAWPADWSDEE